MDSVELPISIAFDRRFKSAKDIQILAIICSYADENGVAKIGRPAIKKLTGFNLTRITEAFGLLESAGYVTRKGNGKGQFFTINFDYNRPVYRVGSDDKPSGLPGRLENEPSGLSGRLDNEPSGLPGRLEDDEPSGLPGRLVANRPVYRVGSEDQRGRARISNIININNNSSVNSTVQFGDVVGVLIKHEMPEAFAIHTDVRKDINGWIESGITLDQISQAAKAAQNFKGRKGAVGTRLVSRFLNSAQQPKGGTHGSVPQSGFADDVDEAMQG